MIPPVMPSALWCLSHLAKTSPSVMPTSSLSSRDPRMKFTQASSGYSVYYSVYLLYRNGHQVFYCIPQGTQKNKKNKDMVSWYTSTIYHKSCSNWPTTTPKFAARQTPLQRIRVLQFTTSAVSRHFVTVLTVRVLTLKRGPFTQID